MTPPDPARAAAVVHGLLMSYRHTWRGTVVGSFLAPVFFLLSLGVGLGAEVDDAGRLGVDYLHFVAPGLLAASAMQIAAVECMWPVMAGMRWLRTFHAILASPASVADLVAGRLAWVGLRVAVSAGVFLAVVAAFGAADSPLALFAVPAAVLTGLAFAAPIEAFAATREREDAFAGVMRFLILPMFLFAGTFFPVDRLPDGIEWVAWITPVWHGVEVCRGLFAGDPDLVDVAHVAVLAVVAAAGSVMAARAYRVRMRS